jgi:hypothetical protein
MRGLLTLAKPWWAWLFLLMLVNLLIPLVFLGTPEAHWTLIAFFVAFGIQATLFRFKGFVRLLGVGHIIPWVPLVLWLWTRLGAIDPSTPFGQWILAVIFLNGISLVIDLVDVFRYLAGDRTPSITLEELSKRRDRK